MKKGLCKTRRFFAAIVVVTLGASHVLTGIAAEMPAPVEVSESGMAAPVATTDAAPQEVGTSAPVAVPSSPIVATDHQLYTHEEMMQDIAALKLYYPDIISYSVAGTSREGREIPVIYLGNPSAPRHVMIQSSMHAREYMATILTMAMIEHYAVNYRTGSVNDVPYATLFQNVCFVILPMVNPDGVSISQFGVNGSRVENTRAWLGYWQATGKDLTQIKANAAGVDLNKNFPTGFGRGSGTYTTPSLQFYAGTAALSEKESQILMDVTKRHNYAVHINYHTMGNIIYYGAQSQHPYVNPLSAALATMIKNRTGYALKGQADAVPSGTYADYVCGVLGRPSATVELGTANPVPIAQFAGIYQRNVYVWGDIAYAVYAGWF